MCRDPYYAEVDTCHNKYGVFIGYKIVMTNWIFNLQHENDSLFGRKIFEQAKEDLGIRPLYTKHRSAQVDSARLGERISQMLLSHGITRRFHK